jgi:hypothetical protein
VATAAAINLSARRASICSLPAMQRLLLAFADFADDNGVCWPSKSTIAPLARERIHMAL